MPLKIATKNGLFIIAILLILAKKLIKSKKFIFKIKEVGD